MFPFPRTLSEPHLLDPLHQSLWLRGLPSTHPGDPDEQMGQNYIELERECLAG